MKAWNLTSTVFCCVWNYLRNELRIHHAFVSFNIRKLWRCQCGESAVNVDNMCWACLQSKFLTRMVKRSSTRARWDCGGASPSSIKRSTRSWVITSSPSSSASPSSAHTAPSSCGEFRGHGSSLHRQVLLLIRHRIFVGKRESAFGDSGFYGSCRMCVCHASYKRACVWYFCNCCIVRIFLLHYLFSHFSHEFTRYSGYGYVYSAVCNVIIAFRDSILHSPFGWGRMRPTARTCVGIFVCQCFSRYRQW